MKILEVVSYGSGFLEAFDFTFDWQSNYLSTIINKYPNLSRLKSKIYDNGEEIESKIINISMGESVFFYIAPMVIIWS